ncbi:MAG: TIGR02996 domain-containing protein [Kofleriaceae bacterium]
MTDEAALLSAIRDAPDDDAPRLVYADWLIERGDPRGEYIALACSLGYDAYVAAEALWQQHEQAWRAVLPPILRDARLTRRRHGFIEQLSYPGPIGDVLAADVVAALVALAPIPDVWISSRQVHLYFRSDGRAAVRVQFLRGGALSGMGHVDVIALPSRRRLARASHPIDTLPGDHSPNTGLPVHVTFDRHRDVVRYDLRDGPTDAYAFLPQELAY